MDSVRVKLEPLVRGFFTFILLFCVMNTGLAQEVTKVTILADDDYPPYSYVEKGKLKGIYVRLIHRAANYLPEQYKVNLVAMPWKRALAQIENGRALAIIPPYLHIEARPYIEPYSIPLGTESVVTYCRKHVPLQAILDSLEFSEWTIHIGINAGYILLNDRYYRAINAGKIKMWENKSTDANLMKLLTNKIDCYVNDSISINVALNHIKKELQNIDITGVEEMDRISSNTAHIGYSNTNNSQFPFKDDFVIQMNKAIKLALMDLDKTNQ